MPFEHQARKYGWSAIEQVDRLHECLRGAAVRYICSLPEHTREDLCSPGTATHSTLWEKRPPNHNKEEANYQQVQPNRGHSQTPSPNCGAVGPCFKCGETGHFRKDCVRPPSPVAARNHSDRHTDYLLQSDGAPNSDPQLQRRQTGCTKKRGGSLQIPLT